ncbi:hypothetical protein P9112_005242 [Eukaryota sp. TZLM1-RC]
MNSTPLMSLPSVDLRTPSSKSYGYPQTPRRALADISNSKFTTSSLDASANIEHSSCDPSYDPSTSAVPTMFQHFDLDRFAELYCYSRAGVLDAFLLDDETEDAVEDPIHSCRNAYYFEDSWVEPLSLECSF